MADVPAGGVGRSCSHPGGEDLGWGTETRAGEWAGQWAQAGRAHCTIPKRLGDRPGTAPIWDKVLLAERLVRIGWALITYWILVIEGAAEWPLPSATLCHLPQGTCQPEVSRLDRDR